MGVAGLVWHRRWAWGVLATLATLIVCSMASPAAATAPAPTEAPAGEVKRLKFAFSSNDATERQLVMKQIERFNAAHPGVEVRAVPRLWEGYGIFDSYVRFLALQDPSVDIYMVDNPWIPEFVEPGWLLPLDEHVSQELLAQLAENAVRWGKHQGRLYGLPLNFKSNMLLSRRDLLEKHGRKAPQTIQELGELANLLQREESLEVGLAIHSMYLHNDVFPFFFASGGDVVEDGKSKLASPANAAALAALVSLFHPSSRSKSAVVPLELFAGEWSKKYPAPLDTFKQGQAAFAIGWSRNFFDLQKADSAVSGKVGVSAIPGVTAGAGGGSNFGSWYLVVSSASHHPAEAVEFVKYMVGPEVQRERLLSLGEVPVRKDLLADTQLVGAFHVPDMLPILERARPRPRVPNERAVDAVIERHLHAAVRGEETPEKALASAHSELQPLLPREQPAPLHAPDVEVLAPSGATSQARLLQAVSVALALFMLAVPWLLVWLRNRFRLPILRRIRAKLFVFGTVLSGVLLAVSAGLVTGNAITDQDREYDGSREFFREQMVRHATTTAKNLSLSASIVADFAPAAGAELGTAEMKQLMMASHFSEDLLFFEVWNKAGARVLSQQDALYLDRATKGDAFPPAADLETRVLQRAIHVSERQSESGVPYLEAVAPIHRHGEHLGSLRIGLSQARFSEQLERVDQRHHEAIRRIAATGGILALLLLAGAMLASVILSRRLATPIVELTEKAEAIRRGALDVQIVPRTNDEIGALASTMAEMVQGLRDRDFIREVLGRYVESEIVERFLADPSALALGGVSRRVTLLMSDLRGFTRLAAELGPARTIQLLNRYFAEMFEVIQRHRGLINEVRGDGILVVFGVPEAADDDAQRAIACAVEMQLAMARFRDSVAGEGWPPISMGIGIHTGEVIAGNIGSEQRAKFGVVGDAVNLAARIESFTLGDDVLASTEAIEAAGSSVRAGPCREVRVKGRADAIVIHSVLGVGELALEPPAEAPLLSLPAPGVEVALRVVDDAEVGERAVPATLVRYAPQAAEIHLPQALEAGTEVVLRVTSAGEPTGGELFARALECVPLAAEDAVAPGKGFRAVLRWTSVLPADAARLAALSAQPVGGSGGELGNS